MPTDSGTDIAYSATVPSALRSQVEALFFFNPGQPLLQAGIHAVIAHVGMPAIVQSDDRVWIDVPSRESQCLFACDARLDPMRVVGVVLYSRPAADTIWINHIAIDPDYTLDGTHAALRPAMRLVDRMLTTARSIKGVTRVRLPYREARYLRVGRLDQ